MDAPKKKAEAKVKHPPRPTGEKPDARALHERTMARFPKTMARLAE